MIDIASLLSFILHLDQHIQWVFDSYGIWIYAILFFIIFAETGFVVTPFLPGDSLLFAVGAFAATGSLNVFFLFMLLSVAAIGGNTVNYAVGYKLAPAITKGKKVRFIKKEYIERTRKFYEKYGGKTIILTRFIPILRTFAPFMAGVGSMSFWKFQMYNIIGGIAWIGIFLYSGYFFGNIPFVKQNFTIVILVIIIVSLIPAAVEYVRHRRQN
ncbi:DedA family protein [Candidatus Woesearchaeota archaeon]|nr:DedA family protein [Candidatus Woesearchaeota archaeon]